MTTTNGNGRKTKKVGALVTETAIENLPTVEELLEHQGHQTHQGENVEPLPENNNEILVEHQESTNNHQTITNVEGNTKEPPNSEDVLRQAKKQSRTVDDNVKKEAVFEEEVNRGELVAGSASAEANQLLVSSGQDLLNSQESSSQEMAAAGSEDAINDADAYATAYQATLLQRLAHHKVNNARSLREQMNLVRQHVDATSGAKVKEIIESYGARGKQEKTAASLGEIKKVEEVKGFQILPKK